MRSFLSLAVLLLAVSTASAQTKSSFSNVCVSSTDRTVDQNKVSAMVNTLLGSKFLSATNIKFIGNCTCAGIATIKSTHALSADFTTAVVLATGQGSQAVKEKNSKVDTWSEIKPTQPGSAAIEAEFKDRTGKSVATYDACGVSFDLAVARTVKSASPTLSFPYVFGSEEYMNAVDQDKSDMFGFYLDNNNVAVIQADGAMSSVHVDTVNNDVNSALFHLNTITNDYTGDAPGTDALEWDGYTSLLTTVPYTVVRGSVVPVTLVIADVGDNRLDSAVYLRSSLSICGDGIVNGAELCDDGNDDNHDGCNNWCKPSKCLQAETHACGDPHIESFDGADFLFTGWPDAYFNMLSHPSYQLNAYFRKYRLQDASKTWIGAVGFKVGQHDKIEVTGVAMGKMVVKVNGQELSQNTKTIGDTFELTYITEADGDHEVRITTPDMVVVIDMDNFNWNLDLDIEKISMSLGNMHGIIGQSYRRMVAQKTAFGHAGKGPRAVDGVEGEEADYNVKDGLFGNDFKYNMFQGTDVEVDGDAVQSVASSSRKAMEVVYVTSHAGLKAQ